MSRQFSTGAGTDSITFSAGAAPGDQGPITVAVLAKAFSTAGWTGWAVRGVKSGGGVWAILTSNNAGAKFFAENDFSNGVAGLSTSWRWYVMTKASGSATPRWHVWDLSGAWSHTDTSATVGDNIGPIDTIYVGSQTGSVNGWRGSIAVAAAFTTAMTDAAVEAAFTLAAADTLAASPSWMIRLNQASTATSVTDDTGGGGNQTAISGTSVDADDPPSYNYSLTPPVTLNGSGTAGVSAGASGRGALGTSGTRGVSAGATGRGALGTSGTRGATVGATGSGIISHGGSAPVIIGATGEGTVVGGEPPESPAGWNTLMGAINEARAEHRRHRDRERHPLDCPDHHWPLQPVGGNRYHCQFGGHVVRGQ